MPSQIAIRQYLPSDAEDAVAVWNSGSLGVEFPIDLRLWRQSVDECAKTVPEATLIACDGTEVVGLIVSKAPHHLSTIVVAPTHQRQGIGRALVRRAEEVLGNQDGVWIAGQDPARHFFPGVPDTAPDALAFFEALGFAREGNPSFDLMRDLTDYTVPPTVQMSIQNLAEQGIVLAPCRTQDVSPLLAHLASAFPGRWLTDTTHRLDREPDPSEIMIARRFVTGEVLGFAHTYSNVSRVLGPPVYWRTLLGADYGGLGPIGVAPDARGLGLGLALLCWSVETLKRRGVTRMAIDWTDLIAFYAKAGFMPWKRYLPLRRP